MSTLNMTIDRLRALAALREGKRSLPAFDYHPRYRHDPDRVVEGTLGILPRVLLRRDEVDVAIERQFPMLAQHGGDAGQALDPARHVLRDLFERGGIPRRIPQLDPFMQSGLCSMHAN